MTRLGLCDAEHMAAQSRFGQPTWHRGAQNTAAGPATTGDDEDAASPGRLGVNNKA